MTETEFIEGIESCKSQLELDQFCRKNVIVWFENDYLNRRIYEVRCKLIGREKHA